MTFQLNTIRSIFLCILITSSVYALTISNDFVWDDHALVQNRDVYRTFDIKTILTSPANGVEYLPVRDISYAIDYAVWGDKNPKGFHTTNLLILLATIPFVFFTTIRFLALVNSDQQTRHKQSLTAFFITLLYLTHPLQAQSVNLIICRNVLLAALFFYISTASFLHYLTTQQKYRYLFYAISLICYPLAVLSKGTAIILPGILLVATLRTATRNRLQSVTPLFPFFSIGLALFLLFKNIAYSSNIIKSTAQPLLLKFIVALQIPWFYITKFILPINLASEYDVTFANTLSTKTFVYLFATAALVTIPFVVRKKSPSIWMGVSFFILSLIPVLNFFATNPIVADRYAFFPIYGLVFLTGTAVMRAGFKKIWSLAAIVVITLTSVSTFKTNAKYASDKTLWEANITTAPGQVKGYTNLGWVYFYENNFDKAFSLFKQEQALAPSSINLELAQGYRYYTTGNITRAIPFFEKALLKKDDALYPLYLLAKSRLATGNRTGGIEILNRILISKEADLYEYRPFAQNMLKELEEYYIPVFQKIAENIPDRERQELISQIITLGFYEKTLEQLQLLPDSQQTNAFKYGKSAEAEYMLGKYEHAVQSAQLAYKFSSQKETILLVLGKSCLKLNQFENAIEVFKNAVILYPDKPLPALLLAVSLYKSGNRQTALDHFLNIRQKFPDYDFFTEPYILKLKPT